MLPFLTNVNIPYMEHLGMDFWMFPFVLFQMGSEILKIYFKVWAFQHDAPFLTCGEKGISPEIVDVFFDQNIFRCSGNPGCVEYENYVKIEGFESQNVKSSVVIDFFGIISLATTLINDSGLNSAILEIMSHTGDTRIARCVFILARKCPR